MPRGDWPYTVVVPALVLKDSPGERQSARIDFADIELAGSFRIEFWFKTEAYPAEGASAVLMAKLKTSDNRVRDLILSLDGQHMTPEFQDFHGPLAKPPSVAPMIVFAHTGDTAAAAVPAGSPRLGIVFRR